MKIRFLLPALIMLILISCNKEKDKIEPDNILFSDLVSPITKSTVRDWYIEDHGVCIADIPVPEDSSTAILLDVNNDAENDFIVLLSHSYWEPTEYCGHCSIYDYRIRIEGTNGSDSIASLEQSTIATYFGDSDSITFDNSWTSVAILVMKGGCVRPTFAIEDEYIGIKHNNQIGWIKVASASNNGLTIENYAINLTDNKIILAGQTE